MYSRGSLLGPGGSWSTRLAYRALIAAIGTFIAASAIQTFAAPSIRDEVDPAAIERSGLARAAVQLEPWLIWLCVPGFVLAVAAIVLKPLRFSLAVLAMLMIGGATLAIFVTLFGSLAPLYPTIE